MFFMSQKKSEMISPEAALSGRDTALTTAKTHFLSGRPLKAEVPLGYARGDVRHGVLLGRRADVLGHRWRFG